MIGTDDPLQAIGDALVTFPANEILFLTSDTNHQAWLEQGLKRQARQLFRIPVALVAVETRKLGPKLVRNVRRPAEATPTGKGRRRWRSSSV